MSEDPLPLTTLAAASGSVTESISRVLTLIESIDTADVDYLVDILADVLRHPELEGVAS